MQEFIVFNNHKWNNAVFSASMFWGSVYLFNMEVELKTDCYLLSFRHCQIYLFRWLKGKKKTCHLFANMWKCIISVLVLVNFIEEEEGNMFQDEVFVRDG